MPHFQTLIFVKPFQMLHCPSRRREFHIKVSLFGQLPTLHRPLFLNHIVPSSIVRVRTLELHSLAEWSKKSVFDLAWKNPRMRIWVSADICSSRRASS
jgi:hypothetical protein